MKKAGLVLLMVSLVLAFVSFGTWAGTETEVSKPHTIFGFSLPTIGGASYNEVGNIKSMFGLNIGLGISYRQYFGTGLQPNQFNGFWGVGTFILIIPYWEFGVTYPIPLAGGRQLLDIDLEIIYIIPSIGISIIF